MFALVFLAAACESPTVPLEDPTGPAITAQLSQAAGVGAERVGVCHYAPEEGSDIAIWVSAAALDAHVRHGDKVIGQEVNEACEPLQDVTLDASAPESMVGEALPSENSDDPDPGPATPWPSCKGTSPTAAFRGGSPSWSSIPSPTPWETPTS